MDRQLIVKGAVSALLASALWAAPAQAQITGNLNVTLTLTKACYIDGTLVNYGAPNRELGSIDFADQNTFFDTVSAVSNAIAIRCSPSTTTKLTVNGGKYPDSNQRRMKHAGTENFVNYALFTDAEPSAPIPTTNGEVPMLQTGVLQNIVIRATATGPGATGVLPAGEYEDVIVLTLTI